MGTNCAGVEEILRSLASTFATLVSSPCSASAYGNIIYGLQNCSCKNEHVLEVLSACMKAIDAVVQQPNLVALHDVLPTTELLSVHQALCITMTVVPDLDDNEELKGQFQQLISRTLAILQARKLTGDLRISKVSSQEFRLASLMRDILASEPFSVTCGDLLHGFESAAVVTLHADLLTADVKWRPVLNIEVHSARSTRPTRAHYERLRQLYLSRSHGVSVETAPAEAFNLAPGFQRNILRTNPHLLDSLRPQTPEDQQMIDTALKSSRWTGGLLSTVNDQAHVILNAQHASVEDKLGRNFSTHSCSGNYGMYLGWLGPLPECAVKIIVSSPSTRVANPKSAMLLRPVTALSLADGAEILDPASQTSPGASRSSHRDASGTNKDDGDGESINSSDASTASTVKQTSLETPTIDVDSEIALLERQLEIARMEARLLELRAIKSRK